MNKTLIVGLAAGIGGLAIGAGGMYIYHKRKVKKLEEEYLALCSEKIDEIMSQLEDSQIDIEAYKQYVDDLEADYDDKRAEIDDLKREKAELIAKYNEAEKARYQQIIEEQGYAVVTPDAPDPYEEANDIPSADPTDEEKAEVLHEENMQHWNVFDHKDDSDPGPIDEERQKRHEEGKNHLLDGDEKYWREQANKEYKATFGEEPYEVINHSDYLAERKYEFEDYRFIEASYYELDDVLIEKRSDEVINDIAEETIGWDWVDAWDEDTGFVIVIDHPRQIRWEIECFHNESYQESVLNESFDPYFRDIVGDEEADYNSAEYDDMLPGETLAEYNNRKYKEMQKRR